MCGSETYNAHSGTDIRLSTLTAQRAGVDVLAAASGRVLRARDGVRDISTAETGRAAVAGQECGNGLVIAHADGYETQYCHMAMGSLAVRPGQQVAAGERLGRVGLSGDTEFPHLHLTVRHNGQLVDPFADGAAPGSCGGGRSLWAPDLQTSLAYKPGEILNVGFVSGPVTMADVENGAGSPAPGRDAPALVAFVRPINLRKGDVQTMALSGPAGELASNRLEPLAGNRAQSLLYVGKKKPATGWAPGEYSATYTVLREGKIVVGRTFKLTL
jgi:murein DD-endopeptidase MepM/ murein hydrolase activator NlpD